MQIIRTSGAVGAKGARRVGVVTDLFCLQRDLFDMVLSVRREGDRFFVGRIDRTPLK